MGYKGMMLSGVPNLAIALGYTNASWTLKCDLDLRVRLPAAQPHGRARLRVLHPGQPRPLGDRRAVHRLLLRLRACARSTSFPKQGSRHPWRLYQNYARDIVSLRYGSVEDEAIQFSRPTSRVPDRSAERAGVLAVLRAILAELDLTVGLSGQRRIADLGPELLAREGDAPG